jgi:type III pantothenate kinase
MNLIVDIGNSSTKVAIFDGSKKIDSFRTRQYDCSKIEQLLSPHNIDKAIICSVKDIPDFIYDLLTINIPFTHKLTHRSKFPFSLEYESPGTLGPDRIAAIAGAWFRFPGKEVLVIDAGSAMTFDYLEGKVYLGGNISPGLTMRFRSLHYFTGKLPLVTSSEKYSSPGKNTVEAITAGVIDGLVFEINEYIRKAREAKPNLKVVLTGGDGEFLKEKIRFDVDLIPDLVLEGLNQILIFNSDV